MKKLTLAATFALLTVPAVHADTILGVYAGAGSWISTFEGTAGQPSIDLKDLGVKEHAGTYFYVALEHPIPIIPNIMLERTSVTSQQTADIAKTFTINGTSFNVNDTVASDFDLTHTDATLYYEILDNWINFDLGLTLRKFDGNVSAITSTSSEKISVDQTLPLLYGKAQFDLPFSGLSIGTEVKYVSYQKNKLTDYSVKLSYLFDSALDLGIEAGIRKMALTIDESDLKAKIDLNGPYAALIAHF